MGFFSHSKKMGYAPEGSEGTPVNPTAKRRMSSCTAECFYYSTSANLVSRDYTDLADSLTGSTAFTQ